MELSTTGLFFVAFFALLHLLLFVGVIYASILLFKEIKKRTQK